MNRDSNAYTFIFATVMVVVVATALAFTATSLKPRQDDNARKEKMQNILATIGVDVDRDGAEAKFNQYITEQYSLTAEGEIDETTKAFDVDLNKELKNLYQHSVFRFLWPMLMVLSIMWCHLEEQDYGMLSGDIFL